MTPPPRPAVAALPLSRAAFVLSRLRRNLLLQGCAILAFVEYGALFVWAIFGRSTLPQTDPQFLPLGTWFGMACFLAVMSLGSWFFLFRWYRWLQEIEVRDDGDGSVTRMGQVFEAIAVGCVAIVHGLLAWILVQVI